MKSDYNCKVNADHVPTDEEYGSTFGKDRPVVIKDCRTDTAHIVTRRLSGSIPAGNTVPKEHEANPVQALRIRSEFQ